MWQLIRSNTTRKFNLPNILVTSWPISQCMYCHTFKFAILFFLTIMAKPVVLKFTFRTSNLETIKMIPTLTVVTANAELQTIVCAYTARIIYHCLLSFSFCSSRFARRSLSCCWFRYRIQRHWLHGSFHQFLRMRHLVGSRYRGAQHFYQMTFSPFSY